MTMTATRAKTTSKTTSEVLWDALDLLKRKGWTKRTAEDAQFRHCLGGAVECSAWETDTYGGVSYNDTDPERRSTIDSLTRGARQAVTDTIQEQYGQGVHIEKWNDHPSRIYNDVEAVLYRTAVRLEGEDR